MTKVSLITTVYNGARFLDDFISMVSKQKDCTFEHLIIDDGSTDGTAEKLKLLQQQYEFLKVIVAPRLGRVAALNLAVDQASGDYLANLDVDDVIYEKRLALQSRFLDEHPAVGVVGGAYVVDQQLRSERLIRRPPSEHGLLVKQLVRLIPFSHSVVMFRKIAWQEAQGYKDVANEDLYLWFEMVKCGWQLGAVNELVGEHRKYRGSYWQANFSYLKRQLELARLQGRIATELKYPLGARLLPYARVLYPLLPNNLKGWLRRSIFGVNEENHGAQ